MKMLCELLERYLKNELNKKDKELFENHIKECAFCAKQVELDREVTHYLNSIPKVKVPGNFSTAVMEKIHEHKQKVIGWYVYAAVAFMSFLSVVFVVGLIGLDNFISDAVSLGHSVYDFANSLVTAIITLSGTLYNVLTPGKVNGVVLIFAFMIILTVFLKSIKLFASVEK